MYLGNFLKTILSDKVGVLKASKDRDNWIYIKIMVQELVDLGYLMCNFGESERITNIVVTMKGERFCKSRSR